MIASALETNALDMEPFSKFDLDPGSVVVLSFPLVPDLFAWAQKILRLAILFTRSEHVMLSLDSGCHVQMVLLHATDHCCCLDQRLLYHRLGRHDNFSASNWLLFDDKYRSWFDCFNDNVRTHSFTMIKDDLGKLYTLHVPVIVEFESDHPGLSMQLWELEQRPGLESELENPEADLIPASIESVPDENSNLSR